MPDDPKGFSSFDKKIAGDASLLDDLLNKMHSNRSGYNGIRMSMPRFKMESSVNTFDVMSALKKAGVTDLFDAALANFNIVPENISATAFVHKAVMVVDEEGTQAAAASGMSIGLTSVPPRGVQLKVEINKPFVLQVRYASQVLFHGRVTDPTAIPLN